MKATLRIPTKEQYAYLEIAAEGTLEEIINTYLTATRMYKAMADREEYESKPPFGN